jgi:hypothetical protein
MTGNPSRQPQRGDLGMLGFEPVKAAGSGQLRETIVKLKEFSKGRTLGGL